MARSTEKANRTLNNKVNTGNNRYSFGKIHEKITVPYLLDMQKLSYVDFLQLTQKPLERERSGLQEIFLRTFPITNHELKSKEPDIENSKYILEFVKYEIDEPMFSPQECRERGLSFGGNLRVTLRLTKKIENPRTGEKEIDVSEEQEVFFGDIPLMLDNGSFIINGAERVVVSQLHRSPGLFIGGETEIIGKESFSGRLIPYEGSWIELSIDHRDTMFVSIDRKKKLFITTFLRALNYETNEDIFDLFCEKYSVNTARYPDDFYYEMIIAQDIRDDENKIALAQGDMITKDNWEFIKSKYEQIDIYVEKRTVSVDIGKEENLRKYIRNTIFAADAFTHLDQKAAEAGQQFSMDVFNMFKAEGARDSLTILVVKEGNQAIISNTFKKEFFYIKEDDKLRRGHYYDPFYYELLASEGKAKIDRDARQNALTTIYSILRPGSPATIELAESLLYDLFFNKLTYDLGEVGRYKLNTILKRNIPLDERTLTNEDIIESMKYLLKLRWELLEPGDIDHLGNRRVRAVGELLKNHLYTGFFRMKRVIQERMNISEADKVNPQNLVNSRPVTAVLNEFFGSHQLSQFMDQTNPLSEITNKRRLSALGPGGLSRDRAGFEARDVHYTHYGRICPIETPEGQNIGLIASLSTYALIDKYGFLRTPYMVVKNKKVSDTIVYLSADEEEGKIIAQANAAVDEKGYFTAEKVLSRQTGEFMLVAPEDIDYMDVSPKQLVSISAALIPFLEHDDANRALMGSNMQRQGVPLIYPRAPIIGTGIEAKIAEDSGYVQVARRAGHVEKVTANLVVIKADESEKPAADVAELFARDMGRDVYMLEKFRRSNKDTCINTRPIVSVGQRIEKGQALTEGFGTQGGELALGQNMLVAFLSWRGYNFEDAIVLSERVVKDNFFDSIHVEELIIEARETKLGKEEITRDIPQVIDEMVKNLDENGIIRIGTYVKSGDILVGKVTPKGKSELTPEEKLLRAIFGKIAEDVKDASLRVPPGVEGKVMDIKVFTRKATEDMESIIKKERKDDVDQIEREQSLRFDLINKRKVEIMKQLLVGQTLVKDISMIGPKGTVLTPEMLEVKNIERVFIDKNAVSVDLLKQLQELIDIVEDKRREVLKWHEDQHKKLLRGDELPPGVIKLVKVYIANRKNISVGDKMAGRHGNKGVVSIILPVEDMPYLEDGTPVDVVLNPHGVPSRMNVGQILETHLGWAASQKGIKISTPVFDGATEEEIRALLKEAGLPESGKTKLFDGYTGDKFNEEVTVGVAYMMKLHHLVDDKLHARATGPYSLVSQQPLGGKAQFGGQRFGEMEVWALEAYGAAYTLREMLTVKSDDVNGRTKMYEAIIRGNTPAEPGIPESFNVLVNELKGLCLNIDYLKDENKEDK